MNVQRAIRAGRTLVDAEPLRQAILRDAERLWNARDASFLEPVSSLPGISLLAEQLEWGERSLRRIVKEDVRVDEDTADRYCIATNRHLFDLYPELDDRGYDPDSEFFEAPCRFCPSTTLAVLSEARRRMHVRCVRCRRGQYIVGANWTSGPPRSYTAEQAAGFRAEYEAGASIADLARAHGAHVGTMRQTLLYAGVTLRPKPPPPCHNPVEFQRFVAKQVDRGIVTSWRVALLVTAGHGIAESGRILGLKKGCTHRAFVRLRKRHPDWLDQFDRRVCRNTHCNQHGVVYQTPPAHVVALSKKLARCSECGWIGRVVEQHAEAA